MFVVEKTLSLWPTSNRGSGGRGQSLTSFAAECESWVCERELWLACVCLWRPESGGEDINRTQLVWTAPSPAGTVGLHLKNIVVVWLWWEVTSPWISFSYIIFLFINLFKIKWFRCSCTHPFMCSNFNEAVCRNVFIGLIPPLPC